MNQLETPVLFIVFNRLDTTQTVFDEIKKQKPKRLFIAADGPRKNRPGEDEKCQQVRAITKQVDWDCELKTLFRDENLGCKNAVSSAISWFFDQVEQGIILEDDCLPDQSFFPFMEELLERYKTDKRVWNIGGYQPHYLNGDAYSYNFSRYTHIWGWATWADRWKQYDINMQTYAQNRNLLNDYGFFAKSIENKWRARLLNKLLQNRIDTWDYQWNYTVRINNGLSVRPSVNLVHNIGFGADATHTVKHNRAVAEHTSKEMPFPLKHPDFIMVYEKDDAKHGLLKNSGRISKLLSLFTNA